MSGVATKERRKREKTVALGSLVESRSDQVVEIFA